MYRDLYATRGAVLDLHLGASVIRDAGKERRKRIQRLFKLSVSCILVTTITTSAAAAITATPMPPLLSLLPAYAPTYIQSPTVEDPK